MKLSYNDILRDRKRHTVGAQVTTNHSASSYGQPVIVLDTDHEALDINSWLLLGYQIEEASPTELEMLKRVLIIDPHIIAAHLGRLGGSAKSAKKAKSSRHNGRLGGRPRKEPKK